MIVSLKNSGRILGIIISNKTEWVGRVRELAFHLLQHPDDFDREIRWLNSDKARSSVEFGVHLGRFDEGLQFLDRIVIAGRANRNPNLARGYFAGVSEATRPKLPSNAAERVRKKLNASLDELWEEDPVLGFNVMTPSGDFVQSFARAVAGVREKKIRAGFLQTFVAWNGPHTLPVEALLAAQTLLEAARLGDEDAANTGIDFVGFLLMRMTNLEDKLLWLQTVCEDESLDVIFGLLEQAALKTRTLSHWLSQIFVRVLPANPDCATAILIQMMLSESYEISEAAQGLFANVAAVCPLHLMNGIGEVLLSKEQRLTHDGI